jgi:hypothetical protein
MWFLVNIGFGAPSTALRSNTMIRVAKKGVSNCIKNVREGVRTEWR